MYLTDFVGPQEALPLKLSGIVIAIRRWEGGEVELPAFVKCDVSAGENLPGARVIQSIRFHIGCIPEHDAFTSLISELAITLLLEKVSVRGTAKGFPERRVDPTSSHLCPW